MRIRGQLWQDAAWMCWGQRSPDDHRASHVPRSSSPTFFDPRKEVLGYKSAEIDPGLTSQGSYSQKDDKKNKIIDRHTKRNCHNIELERIGENTHQCVQITQRMLI